MNLRSDSRAAIFFSVKLRNSVDSDSLCVKLFYRLLTLRLSLSILSRHYFSRSDALYVSISSSSRCTLTLANSSRILSSSVLIWSVPWSCDLIRSFCLYMSISFSISSSLVLFVSNVTLFSESASPVMASRSLASNFTSLSSPFDNRFFFSSNSLFSYLSSKSCAFTFFESLSRLTESPLSTAASFTLNIFIWPIAPLSSSSILSRI